MDRGVKIAIFVASVAALCLGLIWDQVLSHARVVVEAHSDDTLAGEVIDANIGSPELQRLQPPEDAAPFELMPVEDAPEGEPDEVSPAAAWTEYTVKDGDSYWKLAHVTFKDRGLSSEEIKRANNGKELHAGDKFMVPPNKEALAGGTPVPPPVRAEGSSASPNAGNAGEYTVQDGDSWWKIAHDRLKGRGLTAKQLEDANPGVKLRAGVKIKVP